MLRKPIALAGICCVVGGLLAGCGGSASLSHPARTTTTPARQTPLASNPDIGGAQKQGSHPAAALGQLSPRGSHATAKADKPQLSSARVVQARPTPGTLNDDKSTTGAKPLNPCHLVTLSEAQAITGGAIGKVTEAPLGPTCIYSGKTRAAGVTLAIETESFSQVTRHLTGRTDVVVGGHRSLCGRLGTEMLFVPIAQHQLLNVTAPCGIAQRFAALVVSRLTA